MNTGATATATAERTCYLVMAFGGDEFTKDQMKELFESLNIRIGSGEIRTLQVKGYLQFTRNTGRPWKRPVPCYVTTERAQELSADFLERYEKLTNYINS